MRCAGLLVLLVAASGCAGEIVPGGPGPGLCPEGGSCDGPPVVVIVEAGDAGDAGDAGAEAGTPFDRVPETTPPASTSTPELGGAGSVAPTYLGAGGAGGGGAGGGAS